MKSDVIVIGTLAVFASIVISIVIFETMRENLTPVLTIGLATLGSVPLMFFIRKVLGSDGTDLNKIITAVSLFGSYFAFFMAFIAIPMFFGLVGFIFFSIGIFTTSNLNVVFDSMDVDYNAPEKQNDQSDQELKFYDYFDEVHKRQDYGLE